MTWSFCKRVSITHNATASAYPARGILSRIAAIADGRHRLEGRRRSTVEDGDDVLGLVLGAPRRVALEATITRQQHQQPEGRHQLPESYQPRLLVSVEMQPDEEGVDVQEPSQARRRMLDDVRQLVGNVRCTETLEVDQSARGAVGTVALSHRDAGRPQDFRSIALRSLVDGHDGGERPSIRACRGRDRQCRQQVFL